jgi:CHAD domain-containing protein
MMAKTPRIAHRSSSTDTRRELVAAAALVGTVAVGGTLARGRRASSRRDSERAFRLYEDESTPDGIRRIARGQLDQSHDELADGPKRRFATAVHDTRKRFKRLRATVRLVRGPLGEEAYRRENIAFRDAGRCLAGVREASVLVMTLDALDKVSGDQLPGDATTKLRSQLKNERRQALESLKADDVRVAAVVDEIDSARTRTAAWTFDVDGFEAISPGLRRIYRRGRKAMQRALKEPTTANFHEWRKRVKDLWHAEQILRPASPKKMKKLAKRTHGLADLLGDDHDLAELGNYVATHGDCFDDSATQVALTAMIDRRRAVLQDAAFAAGSKIYSRNPRRFVKAVGLRWREQERPSDAVAS